jgi:L-lactate utilization protein LutC
MSLGSTGILSIRHLQNVDPKIKDLDYDKYYTVASNDSIEKTKQSLESKKYKVTVVDTKEDALQVLKDSIPKGASVNNAASITLEEIGFVNHLKGETGWDNLHAKILTETDPAKQSELRRQATVVDYFVLSPSAVSETGSFVVVDASGSRVGPISFGAKNVIFVLGANKIVPTYEDAVKRAQDFQFPVESARARIAYAAYGLQGSQINNFLAVHSGNPFGAPRYQFIIVRDKLGY